MVLYIDNHEDEYINDMIVILQYLISKGSIDCDNKHNYSMNANQIYQLENTHNHLKSISNRINDFINGFFRIWAKLTLEDVETMPLIIKNNHDLFEYALNVRLD